MNFVALLQALIQCLQRGACLGAARVASLQCDLIAARNRIDAEPLLDQSEVLVELAEEITDEPVVFERENDMRHVGCRNR